MSELMALLGKEDSENMEIEIKKEMAEIIESTDLEQMITQGKQFYGDNLLNSVLLEQFPIIKPRNVFFLWMPTPEMLYQFSICISNLSRILNESAFEKNLGQF